MSNVKVGDIRLTEKKIVYVVTRIDCNLFDAIHQFGGVYWAHNIDSAEKDKLIKHYDTFQEAIASEEFKSCHI